MRKPTLSSTDLTNIAERMRVMNEKPHELMPNSEYMAASGTYAAIAAIESLAQGLKAVEERDMELWIEATRREIEIRSTMTTWMTPLD